MCGDTLFPQARPSPGKQENRKEEGEMFADKRLCASLTIAGFDTKYLARGLWN